MPQIDIFLADNDVEDLMCFVFKGGCTAVPDRLYNDPIPEFLSSADEFLQLRKSKRVKLFFLLHDEWQRAPLLLRPLIKDGMQRYYVQQKTGGPSIDLFIPNEIPAESGSQLPHGFVGYHDRYWNHSGQTEETVPVALKSFYRNLRKYIASNSEVIPAKKRKYYVGRWATRRMNEGLKLGSPISG